MDERRTDELACVDPEVGAGILELDQPTVAPAERRLLEAHLGVCAYCSLKLDLHRRLGEGVRDGSLPLRGGPTGVVGGWLGRRDRLLGWGALAATLACAISLAALPPRPIGPAVAVRGGPSVGFVRPVEGEVVGPGPFEVRWRDVAGATEYAVRVSGDGSAWSGRSATPHLTIPATARLASGGTYRVLLQTVPADLLPPGGVSVEFRTGSRLEVFAHRVRRARPLSYLLALAGLGLAAVYLAGRRRKLVEARESF